MSGTGPYRILREVTRYHRYRLAEVLERAGRKVEALEIFRVFAQDPWAVHFHLPAALAAARIEERRGERESAIAHYAQVLRMWERADPQFQPQVEETREATRRLTGERASP